MDERKKHKSRDGDIGRRACRRERRKDKRTEEDIMKKGRFKESKD